MFARLDADRETLSLEVVDIASLLDENPGVSPSLVLFIFCGISHPCRKHLPQASTHLQN
jgi:hypothetical protein